VVGLRDERRAALVKTKVESVAGEDKETGLDVEACGVMVVLEGELRRGRVCARRRRGKQWIWSDCGCARVMAERTIDEE
jgi:hypothetical protein